MPVQQKQAGNAQVHWWGGKGQHAVGEYTVHRGGLLVCMNAYKRLVNDKFLVYSNNILRYVYAKFEKKLPNSFFKQNCKTENLPVFGALEEHGKFLISQSYIS